MQFVLDACPALANAEESGQEWQLQHPEQCLELLEQLRACLRSACNWSGLRANVSVERQSFAAEFTPDD
jgi:hypothetical protein